LTVNGGGSVKPFHLDVVFGPQASQQEVRMRMRMMMMMTTRRRRGGVCRRTTDGGDGDRAWQYTRRR
jgi:hypothetical protein